MTHKLALVFPSQYVLPTSLSSGLTGRLVSGVPGLFAITALIQFNEKNNGKLYHGDTRRT